MAMMPLDDFAYILNHVLLGEEPTIEDFILLVGTTVAFIAFVLWCCFPVHPKVNCAALKPYVVCNICDSALVYRFVPLMRNTFHAGYNENKQQDNNNAAQHFSNQQQQLSTHGGGANHAAHSMSVCCGLGSTDAEGDGDRQQHAQTTLSPYGSRGSQTNFVWPAGDDHSYHDCT